jgi:hypothetical protein
MAQIFPPSMNPFSRFTILGALGIVAAVLGILYLVYSSAYVTQVGVVREQPVQFSHEHHVSGLGIDCRYCHTSVEESSFAGIPPTETCMTCHSQIWADSPKLELVRASFRTGEPLKWTRVHDVPGYAYFNHAIHVKKGVGCSTCHGPVQKMPLTWREHSLHMKWCLDCHREPERYIRPRDEVFNMDWEAGQLTPAEADQLLLEYHVHSPTNCSACHR